LLLSTLVISIHLSTQVDVDNFDTVIRSRYYTKTLLSNSQSASKSSRICENFIPVLTTKGRPITTDCQCETLRTLSEKVSSIIVGEKMRILKNSLEFSGPRSPLSFRHTVLRTMNRSSADGICLDLVEEAFAAMVLGRMLPPRSASALPSSGIKHVYVHEARPNRRGISANDTSNQTHRRGKKNSPRQLPTIFKTSNLENDIKGGDFKQHVKIQSKRYNIVVSDGSTTFVPTDVQSLSTGLPNLVNGGNNRIGSFGALDWLSYIDEQHNNTPPGEDSEESTFFS